MSSSWRREIEAVIRKEVATELRGKSGIITAGLFSVVTVVAIVYGAYGGRLNGGLAAGLLWIAILFATVVALPRVFLAEEEQGTMDLLRLMGRPHAVFWGKAIFALGQSLATGFLLSGMFLAFMVQPTPIPWLFVLSLTAGCAALSGAVTLCGALVAQADNRAALAAALSVPLLLPMVMMAMGATRVSLGQGDYEGGVRSVIGLIGYATASFAVGPGLFALIWKS